MLQLSCLPHHRPIIFKPTKQSSSPHTTMHSTDSVLYWRPVTAFNQGYPADGKVAAFEGDPMWAPLLKMTPPHPECEKQCVVWGGKLSFGCGRAPSATATYMFKSSNIIIAFRPLCRRSSVLFARCPPPHSHTHTHTHTHTSRPVGPPMHHRRHRRGAHQDARHRQGVLLDRLGGRAAARRAQVRQPARRRQRGAFVVFLVVFVLLG